MEGQVKCQQKLSISKIMKLVRRRLREEDYYQRILSKAIKDAITESKCLETARIANRFYQKTPPEMICCGSLLQVTLLFGNTRCTKCNRWYTNGSTNYGKQRSLQPKI